MLNQFFLLFLFGPILLFLTGCSALKARPAEMAVFLPKPELVTENRSRAPFHGYWVFDPVEYDQIKRGYAKIYIAPVDISAVKEHYKNARGLKERKMDRIQEAEELASYWRAKILLLLRQRMKKNDLGTEIQLVNKPGPEVLTLNLALTEIIPTNPGVNFIGTAAGFLVPGGGLLKLAGEGSVAMEGYVHETDIKKDLYEEFLDREAQKASFFSIKDYQQYAHIRSVIDEWSMQIVALLTTPHSVEVEEEALATLNPL